MTDDPDLPPPGMIGTPPSARSLSPIPADPAEHAGGLRVSTRLEVNGFVNIPGWNGRSGTTATTCSVKSWHSRPESRPATSTSRNACSPSGRTWACPIPARWARACSKLRLKSKEGIGRVFYGNVAGQRIMMLHAFVKKSQKTPAKELNIARARLKEVREDADT